MGSFIDIIAQQESVCRMVWFNKPKQIGKANYKYEPAYWQDSPHEPSHLMYNYIETDTGLRKRVLKNMENLREADKGLAEVLAGK